MKRRSLVRILPLPLVWTCIKKKKKKKKTRFNLMFFRKIVKKKKKSLAFLMFLEHQKIRRFYQDERSHHTLI
jgi:hypothetical protein